MKWGFFYIKAAVGEILFHLTVTVNEIQLTSSDSVDATFYSHVQCSPVTQSHFGLDLSFYREIWWDYSTTHTEKRMKNEKEFQKTILGFFGAQAFREEFWSGESFYNNFKLLTVQNNYFQ